MSTSPWFRLHAVPVAVVAPRSSDAMARRPEPRAAALAEKVADLRARAKRAHRTITDLRLKVAAREARIRALEELLEEARAQRFYSPEER